MGLAAQLQRCELLGLGFASVRGLEGWRRGRPHVLWPIAVDASPMAEVFAPMAVA